DRLPAGVALGRSIAVDVTVTYRGNRPPEFVFVLGIKESDSAVDHSCREKRHEPRAVEQIHILCDDDLPQHWMVRTRANQQPEPRVFGLPRCALRAVLRPELLDLIQKNHSEAREIMQKLGYGPEKRLALKVSTRNIPPFRDPAVILIDQLKE